MREVIYICNHCGRRIPVDGRGQDMGLIDVTIEFPSTDFCDIDLCEDCYRELLKNVDRFLNEVKNNGATQIQPDGDSC